MNFRGKQICPHNAYLLPLSPILCPPSYYPTRIAKKNSNKSKEKKGFAQKIWFITFLNIVKYIQGLLSLLFFYSKINITTFLKKKTTKKKQCYNQKKKINKGTQEEVMKEEKKTLQTKKPKQNKGRKNHGIRGLPTPKIPL